MAFSIASIAVIWHGVSGTNLQWVLLAEKRLCVLRPRIGSSQFASLM